MQFGASYSTFDLIFLTYNVGIINITYLRGLLVRIKWINTCKAFRIVPGALQVLNKCHLLLLLLLCLHLSFGNKDFVNQVFGQHAIFTVKPDPFCNASEGIESRSLRKATCCFSSLHRVRSLFLDVYF